MSAMQRFLWRVGMPLARMLAIANRIPIGERAVHIGPDRLYPPSVDRYLAALCWKLGWLEAAERRLITRLVRPGMVTVDVGANLGLHTLHLARLVGPAGRVYAIEPDPDNFRALERAMSSAGLSQVHAIFAAANDHPGELVLYRSEVNGGDHRIHPSAEARHCVPVSGIVLDDLLADDERVDFLKIDVQGAEMATVRGLSRTLTRSPGIGILCELSPDLLARAGTNVGELLAFFHDAGLTPHRIRGDGTLVPVTKAAARATAEDARYVNLFFHR
jgi:FkbM family methyltransferase